MRNAIATIILLCPVLAQCVNAEAKRSSIGVASAPSAFMVANATALSGATVFQGDSVQCQDTNCRINLFNGSKITLSPYSSAELYADRVSLKSGIAETVLGPDTRIEAQGFSIRSIAQPFRADVQVLRNSMTVAVLSGHAQVLNVDGAELSKMEAGSSLNFAHSGGQAHAGGSEVSFGASIRLLGVLESQQKHFLIRDRYSNTVTELIGDVPDRYLNELTQVEGVVDTQSSSIPYVDRVVRVSSILRSDAAIGMPCLADGINGIAKRIVLDGPIEKTGTHYLISDPRKGTYEVIGHIDEPKSRSNVKITAFVLLNHDAITPAKQVVYSEQRKLVAAESPCVGVSIASGVMITAVVIAAHDWDDHTPRRPISF